MPKIKEVKPSPTKLILEYLLKKTGQAVELYLDLLPHNINRTIYGDRASRKLDEEFYEQRAIRRALADLKKQKDIEVRRTGNKILYRLTIKGVNKALLFQIASQTKLMPNQQFCIVCFDIPESVKQLRRNFRYFLKNMHFTQLQKSVWYTNRDIYDLVCLYIKGLKAGKWIQAIKATSIFAKKP